MYESRIDIDKVLFHFVNAIVAGGSEREIAKQGNVKHIN